MEIEKSMEYDPRNETKSWTAMEYETKNRPKNSIWKIKRKFKGKREPAIELNYLIKYETNRNWKQKGQPKHETDVLEKIPSKINLNGQLNPQKPSSNA